MNPRIKPKQVVQEKRRGWRWAISLAILAHLACVILTYSTNSNRSSIQDIARVWSQPYLIGANWHQEMLPIEWISANHESDLAVTILLKKNPPTDEQLQDWLPVLVPKSAVFGAERAKRLLHVMSELAAAEDQDSVGLIKLLYSMVLHLESIPGSQPLDRIRLQRTDFENTVLFEAAVARLENGDIGLIPMIEPNRTVRPISSPELGGKP